MQWYNKQVFFPIDHKDKLEQVNTSLNGKKYLFTNHFIEQLKQRFSNIEQVGNFLKDLSLQYENIFEYYIEEGNITKVCYRLQYTKEQDIILVLSNNKTLISIFLNAVNDNHKTLNKYQFSLV